MSKSNTKEQEVEKMLDVLSSMWPGDEERVRTIMAMKLAEHYGEAWRNKKKCLNCGANMKIPTYSIGYTHAKTLQIIAEEVRKQMDNGKSFTEANKVYIEGLAVPGGSLTSTQNNTKTIMRYLGLIAKVKENGKHKDSLWAITRWGWAFLRGQPIPMSVVVWRKKVQERSEEVITIRQVFVNDDKEYQPFTYGFVPHDGALI